MQRRHFDGIKPAGKTKVFNDHTGRRLPVRLDRRLDWRVIRPALISMLVVGFLLASLLLINTYRLRGAVTTAATGVNSLLEGMSSIFSAPAKARADFATSESSFSATAAKLRELDSVSKSFLIFPYAREGVQLLQIGYHASLAGKSLAAALADQSASSAPATTFEEAADQTAKKFSSWPAQHWGDLQSALTHLRTMENIFSNLNTNRLPGSLQKTAADWKRKMPQIVDETKAFSSLLNQLPDFFGVNSVRRYVVLFQNNTEMRPTGGFIGSYASLEFTNASLSNFMVQTNVYKSDLAFASQTPITPPYPISEATTVWGMRDANWAVSFPETAQQVLSFYQGIYGKPAHGVIALDTTVVTDLLSLTGPIDFPEYNTSLSADNFVDVVQFKVEKEYFDNAANKKINEPKKILADFIPKLFSALQNLPQGQRGEVIKILAAAAKRKSIQFYSTNEKTEKALMALDVDGRVKEAASDYLYINNANIGGGKSSKNVTQDVSVKQIALNGNIEVILAITRTHHGNGVWPDADNHNYMRILVPKGAELVSTTGAFERHDVTDVGDNTVIAGWFSTPVANKRYTEVHYRLPANVSKKNYSLLIQRQPGENPTTFTFDTSLFPTKSLVLNADTLLK